MRRSIWLFLLFESASFFCAALTHFGVLMRGYEHQKAGAAESVIGIVLLIALALTWIRPKSLPGIGVAAQAFALVGTAVGIFTNRNVKSDVRGRARSDADRESWWCWYWRWSSRCKHEKLKRRVENDALKAPAVPN